MQVSVQCPNCGASQAAEAANTPIIAACAHCGCAITLPAGIEARLPAPYQPPQVAAPPHTLRKAALIAGVVMAALVGLFLFWPRLTFYARYDAPPTPQSPPPKNAIVPKPQADSGYELVDYKWSTSDHGQYSAEFPGQPKDIEATKHDDRGTLAMYRKVFDTGMSHWEVDYVDHPTKPANPGAIMDSETAILTDHNSGPPEVNRTVETEALNGEKFKGRDLRYRTIAGAFRCYRLFIVRNRMYVLGAEVRDKEKLYAVTRFFDSFHLVGELPTEGWKSQYLPK